jgi:hypothetical protein
MSKQSGGGIASNKNVRPGVNVGSRSTNAVSPGAVDRLGQQVVMTRAKAPLEKPVKAAVKLGNEVALNVRGGGPGAGRKVYRTGGQGCHDD